MVKKKAIFFDRDGTLIKTKRKKNKPKAIKNLDECKIFPSVKQILKKLSKKYFLFIITNQPDVFTKKNTKQNVLEINNFLKRKLPIKRIFTCYCKNDKCDFRKPNIGMLNKAKQIYNIDLSKSFVIGDRWRDIDMGIEGGCHIITMGPKFVEKLKLKKIPFEKYSVETVKQFYKDGKDSKFRI